jgi:hypothetical protein
LIDFLLRPEVIAGITNQVSYPSAARLAGMFTIGATDQPTARARSSMWARFKAGH